MKISEVRAIIGSAPSTPKLSPATKLSKKEELQKQERLAQLRELLIEIEQQAVGNALPDEIDFCYYENIGRILGPVSNYHDPVIQKLVTLFGNKRLDIYYSFAYTKVSNNENKAHHFKEYVLFLEKTGLLLLEQVTWKTIRNHYRGSEKIVLVGEQLHKAGLLNEMNYSAILKNMDFLGCLHPAITKLSAAKLLTQNMLTILFANAKMSRSIATLLCKITEKKLYTPTLENFLVQHKHHALQILEMIALLHKQNNYVEDYILSELNKNPNIDIRTLSQAINFASCLTSNLKNSLPVFFQHANNLKSISNLFAELIVLDKNTPIIVKGSFFIANLQYSEALYLIMKFVKKNATQEFYNISLEYFDILKRDAIFVRLERMPSNLFTVEMFIEMLRLCQTHANDHEKAEQVVVAYLNKQFQDLTEQKFVTQLRNDTQSTHTNTIHADTSESIIKLVEQYKDDPLAQPPSEEYVTCIRLFLEQSYKNNQERRQAIHAELLEAGFASPDEIQKDFVLWENFIHAIVQISQWGSFLKENSTLKKAAAYRALDRLLFTPYFVEFKDATSDTTIPELLALFWMAIHDDKLRVGTLEDALELFVEALYEIQRDGNIDEFNQDNNLRDSFICGGGTINKLIEKLRAVHPLVDTRMLTPYLAGLRLPKAVREKVVEHLVQLPATSKTEIYSVITLVKSILIEGAGDLWDEYIEPAVAKVMLDEYGPLYRGGMENLAFREMVAQGAYRSFDKKDLSEIIQKIIIDCYTSLERSDMTDVLQQLVAMDWLSETNQLQIAASQKYKASILNSFKQLERLELATYDNFLLILNHASVLEMMSIEQKIAKITLPEKGAKSTVSPQECFISLMKECDQPSRVAQNSSFYHSLQLYRGYQQSASPTRKRLSESGEGSDELLQVQEQRIGSKYQRTH